jgi:hypothetical protein
VTILKSSANPVLRQFAHVNRVKTGTRLCGQCPIIVRNDSSVRAFAVQTRAFGAPLRGFLAVPSSASPGRESTNAACELALPCDRDRDVGQRIFPAQLDRVLHSTEIEDQLAWSVNRLVEASPFDGMIGRE